MDSIQPRAASPRSRRLIAAATPPFPATATQSPSALQGIPQLLANESYRPAGDAAKLAMPDDKFSS